MHFFVTNKKFSITGANRYYVHNLFTHIFYTFYIKFKGFIL